MIRFSMKMLFVRFRGNCTGCGYNGGFGRIIGGMVVLIGIGAMVPNAVVPVDIVAVETGTDGNIGCSLGESMNNEMVAEDHVVVAFEAREPTREFSSASECGSETGTSIGVRGC